MTNKSSCIKTDTDESRGKGQLPMDCAGDTAPVRPGTPNTAAKRFQPGKMGTLSLSRGRGHGHAIPGMAIADQLRKMCPDVDIRFVSYGNGAVALGEHHRPVIDLKVADSNPIWTTVTRVGRGIASMRAHVAISHEKFAVLPVTRTFNP